MKLHVHVDYVGGSATRLTNRESLTSAISDAFSLRLSQPTFDEAWRTWGDVAEVIVKVVVSDSKDFAKWDRDLNLWSGTISGTTQLRLRCQLTLEAKAIQEATASHGSLDSLISQTSERFRQRFLVVARRRSGDSKASISSVDVVWKWLGECVGPLAAPETQVSDSAAEMPGHLRRYGLEPSDVVDVLRAEISRSSDVIVERVSQDLPDASGATLEDFIGWVMSQGQSAYDEFVSSRSVAQLPRASVWSESGSAFNELVAYAVGFDVVGEAVAAIDSG